jgi:glycerol kinase
VRSASWLARICYGPPSMANGGRAILGVDQGTTGTRACLMDDNGRVLAQSYRAHRQIRPAIDWVEHDPEEIWRNTRQVMLDVVKGQGAAPVALGLANPGETVLLWNRATGEPLGNAIVWQDARTQETMDALAGDMALAARVAAATGLRLDPYFAASKIRWLLDHTPGARGLADAGRLCAGTIDSWLIWKLTAGAAFVTDASTAARTLLYDIHALAYAPWLLELFGVPRAILPEVRPSVPSAGDLGRVTGLGASLDGTPIVASLVDQPAAMIGQGCLEAGQVKATHGTGLFVYLNTGARPQAAAGLLATVAWQADGRVHYALDGGVLTAGSLVCWLRDALALAADADLEAVAGSVPDAGGVVCVPALCGLGAPHWRRSTRAAFLGVGLTTTRAHLARAALEGLAHRVAEVVNAMQAATGAPIAQLRADGGLTASPTLMQLEADLTGIPVAVAHEPEATVMGACYLAARGAGVWASDAEIVARVETERVYQPRIGADERARRRLRFSRAVELVVSWS